MDECSSFATFGNRLETFSSVCNDDDSYIGGHLDNLKNGVIASEMIPSANLRTCCKNLCYLVPVCKVHDLFSDVGTLENPGLDVQIPCEIQVLLDGTSTSP